MHGIEKMFFTYNLKKKERLSTFYMILTHFIHQMPLKKILSHLILDLPLLKWYLHFAVLTLPPVSPDYHVL